MTNDAVSMESLDATGQHQQPTTLLGVDPFDLLTAAWLTSVRSEHTRTAYRRDLGKWVAWCHAIDVDVMAARRVHVDAWVTAGAGYTSTPAPSSLARTLSAVSSFYQYLVDEEVADRNPVSSVRRPEVDRDASSTRGLTRDEAREFLIWARETLTLRDQVAVRLMLGCGLRESSVIGADVDELGIDRGHRVLRVPIKGGKRLTVPLPPEVAAVLDLHLENRGNPTSGPLLVTYTGGRVDPAHLFRMVRATAARALLEQPDSVTPHSLRHTFVTLALDAGAALHEVQDAVGHADPRTTRRYDRSRNRLGSHPAYRLAADLAVD